VGTIGKQALLVLVALLAIAGCGGGGGNDSSSANSGTPQGEVEGAGFGGVKSGEIEIALEIDRYKKPQPEEVNMRILGNFKGAGEGEIPELDLAIESNGNLAGRNVEFLSGPLWKDNKVVVNFDGKVYEPDQATFEELKTKLEDAQGGGGAGDAGVCLEAADDFNIAGVLHNVSFEGKGETLEGVPIKSFGADLDLPAAIGELIKVSADPACKEQLEALGLPPVAQLEELQKQLKGSVVASLLTIGADKNGVVRYLKILANVELPHNEELEVELVVRLNRVNEETELPETHGYSPFGSLLKRFGLDSADVEQADGDEITVSVLEALSDAMSGRETG
jgi:hypothetical protein